MWEDLALAEHSDTANLTLNVCLGRQFTGGDLYFKVPAALKLTDYGRRIAQSVRACPVMEPVSALQGV